MKKNKSLLVILFCIIQYNTSFGQWPYIGLSNAGITSDLTICQDTIYASTYDGIYKKYVFSTDTLWLPCGMQGNHVVQTLVPDYQTLICVAEIGTTYTTQIFKSTDGGATFNLLNPDTSNPNSYQFLDVIAHPDGNYDTLYFLNHQLKTYDGGITWDTIMNLVQNDRFIKVNPDNHDQLVIGGETFALSAYLQTSLDKGDIWNYPAMTSYFAGDNCVHDMIMDTSNAWIAAGEGVICRTTDGGDNWVQLLNVWSWPIHWALYMWDIESSPSDNGRLYVTGDNTGVTRVSLYYSPNHGIVWDTLSSAAVIPGPNLNCLAVKDIPAGDRVFLGGNGVYVFENIVIGTDEYDLKKNIALYPNPASEYVFLERKANGLPLMVQFFDCIGRKMFEKIILPMEEQVKFRVADFSDGVYFARITDEKSSLSLKVVIQH